MINTVIVDDDPGARKRIRGLLVKQTDFRVAAEADNVARGLAAIRETHPDLVFLDVEMPGAPGIDLPQHLNDPPLIVFVSAHKQFALDAFAVEALDYVLKPFTNARFQITLDRVRDRLAESRAAELGTQMHKLIRRYEAGRDDYRHRVQVKHRGRDVAIELNEVVWIEAAGNYLLLHLRDGRQFAHRTTLTAFCEQLDPAEFLRIHRSSAIRLDRVVRRVYCQNSLYRFTLEGGRELTSGRAYREAIESAFEPEP